MVIKHLSIRSFMGYKGSVEIDMPKIAALVGSNGVGKTSVLNAIRYALTGEEPEGDIINKECDECRVELTLVDPVDGEDITFTRVKNRTKPSKFMIDGQKTTAAKLNEKIVDVTGIPLDKIKVLSSADVVASMKPQEFSKFILDYIPEKIDIDFIINNLDKTNPEILDCLCANLPEKDIEMADIDLFNETLKSSRKEVKARLTEKKALYETKPKEEAAPEEEVQDKLAILLDMQNKKDVYAVQKKAYDNALENIKKHEEMISQVKDEMSKITATRPDVSVKEGLQKRKDELKKAIEENRVTISGLSSAIEQLSLTLDALNKPICPISPLITCHEDKSVAKEDISESLRLSEEGLTAAESMRDRLSKEKDALNAEIEQYANNATEYARKIDLAKRLKSLEDNKPALPDAPGGEITDEEGLAEAIAETKELARLNSLYREGETLKGNIEALSKELDTLEYLIKVLGDKGSVRTAIIEKYVKVFEDLLNERSKKVRDDVSFSIIPENGIRILMDTGKGMLPYENLSGGEKAYMIYMIMDMLNSLSGTQLLFIDELSVMDAENFTYLLDIIKEYAGDYDHIIFAAVNHLETVEAVKGHDIPIVSLAPNLKEEKSAASLGAIEEIPAELPFMDADKAS